MHALPFLFGRIVFTHLQFFASILTVCVSVLLRVQAMEGGSESARKNPVWQSHTLAPSRSDRLCGGHLEQPGSEDLDL